MPDQIIREKVEKAIEDQQTIVRTDVEFEKIDEKEDIGAPLTDLLPLTPEQQERLKHEVFQLFDVLREERKEHDTKVEALKAQYGGEIIPEKFMEFNLNVPVTPMKCDAVERLAIRAFLQSDPKFSCSLRPEAVRKGMTQDNIRKIERDQEDYLDYQFDERINIASPLRKTIHQAVTLRGGIIKVPYSYQERQKTREEFYSGKAIESGDVDSSGKPIMIAEGLSLFLKNYPKAVLPDNEGYPYFMALSEFKDTKIKSKYKDAVYDDVKPCFVDTLNFWCRKSVEGYDGLCNEQIYIERVPYTYWEMEGMERNKEMVNVSKMEFTDEKLEIRNEKFKLTVHNALEITYYFAMNENDAEETRVVCRFGEENKVYLGCFLYPYDTVECVYVPFYITDKEPGFYKSGLAEKLTDSNITQNAMLNMMLTEAWLELVSTPITKEGSEITAQLLSKEFKPGVPLIVGATDNINEEIDFLDKPQKQVAAQMIPMLIYLAKLDDSRSGVSDLQTTGNADPNDPRAPAAKTAMLLRQSGINIEDFIDCLLPSFNMVGEITLKLTYQMSTSGRKFRTKQRAERVTGNKDLFSTISRDDMILETVIQSRAGAFAFDKIDEINKNTIVWKMFRYDPIVSRDPAAVRELARTLLESMGPQWKAKADKIVLSEEMFNDKIVKVGLQSLQTYMQAIMSQAKTTGQAPAPDIKQFFAIAAQMLAQVSTPTEQEAKQIQ